MNQSAPDLKSLGPSPLRGTRWWLSRGGLLVASCVISFGLMELAVRQWLPQLPCGAMSKTAIVLYYDEPNGQMRLTPNWEGSLSGVWTKINGDGYRDRTYDALPKAGTVRIAVLGDSYTMGDGVPLEATYPKQLESLFTPKWDVQVLNCGISATNSIQQLATLSQVLDRFQPHIVVLGYNVNDFVYYKQTRFERSLDAGWTHTVAADGKVTFHQRPFTPFQQIKMAIRCRLHIYRLLVRLRDALTSGHLTSASQVQSWIDAGDHLRSFDAVAQMQKLCSAQAVAFRVVVLPALLDIPPSVRQIKDYPLNAEHEMICDHLRKKGIQCTDLNSAFVGPNLSQLVVHRLNRHYNHEGNALIAACLYQLLEPDVTQIRNRLGGDPLPSVPDDRVAQ